MSIRSIQKLMIAHGYYAKLGIPERRMSDETVVRTAHIPMGKVKQCGI